MEWKVIDLRSRDPLGTVSADGREAAQKEATEKYANQFTAVTVVPIEDNYNPSGFETAEVPSGVLVPSGSIRISQKPATTYPACVLVDEDDLLGTSLAKHEPLVFKKMPRVVKRFEHKGEEYLLYLCTRCGVVYLGSKKRVKSRPRSNTKR